MMSAEPVKPKYIDPLVDFAFKRIFGSESNKDLLMAFLNEALRGHKHIADLTSNQSEYPGDLETEGGAIFDLLCTSDQGEKFMIEVQRGKQDNFKQRALFYTSRLISDQAPKGKRNEWKYKLKDVFIQDIYLCNPDTGKIFYDKLSFTYIELFKFDKKQNELETDLDRWLFILKNISTLQTLPDCLDKPIFKKFFNIAEYSKLTKEEKYMWDINQKRRWDQQAVMDTAVKEGLFKGVQQGLAEGLAEGIKLEKRNTVLKLKKMNMPIDKIAAVTSLSIAEIKAIKAE